MVNSNNEVIVRLIGKLSMEFPEIDQLKVRQIIEEVLYKFDVMTQETGLATTDIDDKLQLYFLVKKQEGLSETTLKNRSYQLAIFARYLRKPLANVTLMDIRIFLDARCKKMKPSSMNGQIADLKSFFGWLTIEDYIPKNPTLNLKLTKEPKRLRQPLTLDEVELLRQKCKSLRESCIIEFTYSTGCRLSEIINVDKVEIDWNEMTLHVIGKGNKEREVCFNTKAKYLLREYILSRADDSPALFVSMRNPHGRLGKRALEKEIKNIALRAKFTKSIYPHLLRHSIATHWLHAGMALHIVQKLLGHENPATTQIYAETSKEDVIHAYRMIS